MVQGADVLPHGVPAFVDSMESARLAFNFVADLGILPPCPDLAGSLRGYRVAERVERVHGLDLHPLDYKVQLPVAW